jgi:hypothetical protein
VATFRDDYHRVGTGSYLVEVSTDRLFLLSEERERASGRAPRVGVGRRCRAGPASHRRAPSSPVPKSLTVGPRSGFEGWREPKVVWATMFLGPAR